MEDKKLIIPIEQIKADFSKFLSPEHNRRIIFSGPFGIGKTYKWVLKKYNYLIQNIKLSMKEKQQKKLLENASKNGLLQFRAFDKHVRDSLINNEIIFGAAKNFNDPFDCNLANDFNLSIEEITECINNVSQKSFVSNSDIKKLAKEYQVKSAKLENEMNFLIYEFRRFSCFNVNSKDEVHANSLFWANYANKHQGICMKFKGNIINSKNHFEENVNPLPICYCSNIPEFNYLKYRITKDLSSYKDGKKLYGMSPTEYLLGVKSNHWEYEKEVRFVFKSPDDSPIMEAYKNIKFNPKMLEQVYIGCNANQSTIDEVFKIMHLPKYSHVEVIKLVRDNKRFKFLEERLK